MICRNYHLRPSLSPTLQSACDKLGGQKSSNWTKAPADVPTEGRQLLTRLSQRLLSPSERRVAVGSFMDASRRSASTVRCVTE